MFFKHSEKSPLCLAHPSPVVSFTQMLIPRESETAPCRTWWPGTRDWLGTRDVLCPAMVHQVLLKACQRLLSDFPQWCHRTLRNCPKKSVGLGTRCWWCQAGAHLDALAAGFVGVEINTDILLSNSHVQELIPGHSHTVTLPRGVLRNVVYLWLLPTIFRATEEIVLGCFKLKSASPW